MIRLLILLILCFSSPVFAGGVMFDAGGVDSGGVTCIGWDTPSCTLSTVPTSGYLSANSTLTTLWTATKDGTAVSINAYTKGTALASDVVVLYKDIAGTKTLIAQGDCTSVVNGFTGDVALIAESGQSLDFASGDLLYYGVSWAGGTGIGREDSGGVGAYWNSGAGVAPATITLNFTASRDNAIGFKYE